jgi:hypothetical protein
MLDLALNSWEARPYLTVLVGILSIQLLLYIVTLVLGILRVGRANRQRRSAWQFHKNTARDIKRDLQVGSMSQALTKLRKFKDRVVVREFLIELMGHKKGNQLTENAKKAYDELGFIEEDKALAEDSRLGKQLPAIARMSVYAESISPEKILRLQNPDDVLIEILVLKHLISAGYTGSVSRILRRLNFKNRFFETTLENTLDQLGDEALRMLVDDWDKFSSPFVKRTLLKLAARRELADVPDYLDASLSSDNTELRIGACRAAGIIGGRIARRRLIGAMLEDPFWEVRAKAARELGNFEPDNQLLDALNRALRDPAIWVRRNAAATLASLGPSGLKQLEETTSRSNDAFASDIARQELTRHSQRAANA